MFNFDRLSIAPVFAWAWLGLTTPLHLLCSDLWCGMARREPVVYESLENARFLFIDLLGNQFLMTGSG